MYVNYVKHIIKKTLLFNKYKTWRSPANWESYRKQRNLTTKMTRTSVRTHFDERCAGGPKSKYFWPTVKPFLSNKGNVKDPTIILSEDNIIMIIIIIITMAGMAVFYVAGYLI